MSTRIRYETLVKSNFPDISYVRAYSPGGFSLTIYAGDVNQNLDQTQVKNLIIFLEEIGDAHLLHSVKPYRELTVDNVPAISDPPELIKTLALHGGTNQEGIIKSLNSAFPQLNLKLAKLEKEKLLIWLPSDNKLSQVEIDLLKQYASELISVALSVEIT